MLKKKSPKKADTKDFAELDSAVSELSKQTDALLGAFKEDSSEKPAKPTLPKKQAVGQSKAKHFDIIHDPKKTSKLHATLKTAPKSKTKAVDEKVSAAEEVSQPALKESSTAIVLAHKEGSLNTQPKNAVHKADTEKEVENPDVAKVDVKQPAKSNASSALTFEETDKKETEEPKVESEEATPDTGQEQAEPSESNAPEPVEQAKESGSEPTEDKDATEADKSEAKNKQDAADEPEQPSENKSSEAAQEDEKTAAEPTEKADSSAYRGELYANNLVKDSEPKGYQAKDEGEEKPALFDTEVYHPELHDWSKLEHKSGLNWLILLLVVVVAGALAYLVLTGQKLPYIN